MLQSYEPKKNIYIYVAPFNQPNLIQKSLLQCVGHIKMVQHQILYPFFADIKHIFCPAPNKCPIWEMPLAEKVIGKKFVLHSPGQWFFCRIQTLPGRSTVLR